MLPPALAQPASPSGWWRRCLLSTMRRNGSQYDWFQSGAVLPVDMVVELDAHARSPKTLKVVGNLIELFSASLVLVVRR